MKRTVRYCIFAVLFLVILLLPVLFLETDANSDMGYYKLNEGIISGYYGTDATGSFLCGISPGTTLEKLNKLCLPAQITSPQDPITTGSELSFRTHSGTYSLTAIVTGDLDQDGCITAKDLSILEKSLETNALDPMTALAADINYDGKADASDAEILQDVLDGDAIIRSGCSSQQIRSPMVLLTPGASENWDIEAASYISGNTALVQISQDGKIAALQSEGSTFVYALDENGKVIQRTMVTILSEKLNITLSETEATLYPDQTISVSAAVNHPVPYTVTWTSSDESVATVDSNGTISPVGPGSAVISAALHNGSQATVSINILSTISNLALEKDYYKVKPGITLQLPLTVEPAANDETLTWTSSDPAVATVSNDGTVTTLGLGTVTISVSSSYTGLSASCDIKVCNLKQVAITFDDGPSYLTPTLLDFLKENNIKATFFLVVNRIPSYPDIVIRQVNEGHEMGYHSYSHRNQTELTDDRIIGDFEMSNKILQDLTGASFTVWRTPGGAFNQRVLNCVPVPHILWSVDTLDWASKNEEEIYRKIIGEAGDGSIILLHDLYPTTVQAAIRAMKVMIAGDYEFVTVTELLSRNGTPPKASTTYFQGD